MSRARDWRVAWAAIIATAGAVAAIVVQLFGIAAFQTATNRDLADHSVGKPPLGLLPVTFPEDNPSTPAKVELGRQLFFDTRLSRDRTISCASCHDPARGFSIGERFATGVGGQQGRRHPAALVNVAYNTLQFWDGRVGGIGGTDSLERQVLEPIRDPREMDLDPEEAARRLRDVPEYQQQFRKVFGQEATPQLIARAVAAFERTLLFGDTPFDRYQAGDHGVLSPAALRGKELFFWKAACTACHSGPNFTDQGLHPSVASGTTEDADLGRAAVTNDAADRGLFKTPTLREVGRRSPYMHDGSLSTLEEIVERYNRGGFETHYWPAEQRALIEHLLTSDDPEAAKFRKMAAPQLRAGFPLRLSREELDDLVTFLREGLSSLSPPNIQVPARPSNTAIAAENATTVRER